MKKRFLSVLLAAVVAMGSFTAPVSAKTLDITKTQHAFDTKVKATEDNFELLYSDSSAQYGYAGKTNYVTFKSVTTNVVVGLIYANTPSETTLNVSSNEAQSYNQKYSVSDWEYDAEDNLYCLPFFVTPYFNNATINVDFTFNTSCAYMTVIMQDKTGTLSPDNGYGDDYEEEEKASINCTAATITEGFSKTVKVEGGKVAHWSTSNKKVATVKNGKISAKKKGKCKITATLTNGQKLTCNVTVKTNEYTDKKITLSDVNAYDKAAQLYKASYDKKGNLVLKVRFVNNSYRNYSFMKNVKISIATDSGKNIGTFKLAKHNVKIGSYSYKDLTYTIKKANLKIKKADLRNAVVKKCSATLIYYY